MKDFKFWRGSVPKIKSYWLWWGRSPTQFIFEARVLVFGPSLAIELGLLVLVLVLQGNYVLELSQYRDRFLKKIFFFFHFIKKFWQYGWQRKVKKIFYKKLFKPFKTTALASLPVNKNDAFLSIRTIFFPRQNNHVLGRNTNFTSSDTWHEKPKYKMWTEVLAKVLQTKRTTVEDGLSVAPITSNVMCKAFVLKVQTYFNRQTQRNFLLGCFQSSTVTQPPLKQRKKNFLSVTFYCKILSQSEIRYNWQQKS